MKTAIIFAAIALLLAANGSNAMTFEVDALYAEDAYEPTFIEVESIQHEPALSLLETEAKLAKIAKLDIEADAEENSEDAVTRDSEEEYSFAEQEMEDEPAPNPAAAATTTPAPAPATATPTPAPTATTPNATAPNSTTNATFVPNGTAPAVPTGPNPLDPCGCYNGASCQVKVCICPSQWTGQWCERPSPIALARQTELDRLANLTTVIQRVATQVGEIEAASGSPAAVQRLIAEAARKEIILMNVQTFTREFYHALSNNDMFVAKEKLNLIKHMDAEKYPGLLREFHVQEERIAKSLGEAKPGIKVMDVPVMQELKYKDIDVTHAKDIKAVTFERANTLVDKALQQARQFNLDFGDPL